MGISKRKWISVILCFALLVGVFSTYNVKAEEKPLWILADLPVGLSNNKSDSEWRLRSHLKYAFGPDFDHIKLEYLPSDEEERMVRIAALRVEIMAGGGPDVFILSCALPFRDKTNLNTELLFGSSSQTKKLFLDPKKAMQNRLLLSLDSYIKTGRFFEPDKIHPVVLEAGKLDGKQMILPITITFPVIAYEKGSVNQQWAKEYARGATSFNQFSSLFGEVADYSKERLLFSKKELLETVKSVMPLVPEEKPENVEGCVAFRSAEVGGFLVSKPIDCWDMRYWEPGYYAYNVGKVDNPPPQEIAPVYNREGGVTAQITAYACININTKHPVKAFQVIDFLFSDVVQNCNGERNPENTETFQADILFPCFGVPARDDLMQSQKLGFRQCYVGQLTGSLDTIASPETFEIYTGLRDQITTARFYGSLDEELQNMFNQCREADSDEEIEKIVSRAYETMTIMLGE